MQISQRERKPTGFRKLRRSQGFSLAKLSGRSGINRCRLSHLELGYQEPSVAERLALFEALVGLVAERSAVFYSQLRQIFQP